MQEGWSEIALSTVRSGVLADPAGEPVRSLH